MTQEQQKVNDKAQALLALRAKQKAEEDALLGTEGEAVLAAAKAIKQTQGAHCSGVAVIDDEKGGWLLQLDITIPKETKFKPAKDGAEYLFRDLTTKIVKVSHGGKEYVMNLSQLYAMEARKEGK